MLLLSRGRRYLNEEHIAAVISAVSNMETDPFMLKDLDNFLPEEIRNKKGFRRSVAGLLETLVEIGYLSKPTQRKYLKLHPTLSQYLSSSLFELAELERRKEPKISKEEKIIRLGNNRGGKHK
ncbi:MAG: hypothetical protein QXT12_02425 [Nitrososphaerota archaeon]